MWRNACENCAGSKNILALEGGKGSLHGCGFPSPPTAPSTSVPKVKAKGTPHSPSLNTSTVKPILTLFFEWLDSCGWNPSLPSLLYFTSSFKIKFKVTFSETPPIPLPLELIGSAGRRVGYVCIC